MRGMSCLLTGFIAGLLLEAGSRTLPLFIVSNALQAEFGWGRP